MLLSLDLKNEKLKKKKIRHRKELEVQWVCKALSYKDSAEQWGKRRLIYLEGFTKPHL